MKQTLTSFNPKFKFFMVIKLRKQELDVQAIMPKALDIDEIFCREKSKIEWHLESLQVINVLSSLIL